MKRTDLVPLVLLGLAGVAFGAVRGDSADDALALGLGWIVVAVIAVVFYRNIKAVHSPMLDHPRYLDGPTFTNRQMVQMILVAAVIGILLAAVQLARG